MVYFDQILHTNACQHYLTTDMCNSFLDEVLLSIISAGCGQLVKTLITLDCMVYLDQIVHTYLFDHCPANCMQNGGRPWGASFWSVEVF